jgi:hypothetical protein
MLSLTQVLEVRRLLDEGALSQRAIAQKLRISRGIVGAIASGERGLFGRDEARPHKFTLNPSALPVRCPDCGGLVYKPCLLCAARANLYGVKRLNRMLANTRRSPRPYQVPRRIA